MEYNVSLLHAFRIRKLKKMERALFAVYMKLHLQISLDVKFQTVSLVRLFKMMGNVLNALCSTFQMAINCNAFHYRYKSF